MIQLLLRTVSVLRFREDGQTIVEYALVLALVSITAVAVLTALSVYPSSVLSQVTADL
jgi:Flp pilus assembly pilin Flp